MQLRNTPSRYGGVAIVLHWLAAIAIVGLFALGYWMVDLTYYHDWYKRAPDIHRSIGLLLFGVMLLRVVWRLANPVPKPLPEHSRVEVLGAHAVHGLLYLLIFVAMVSGYLISTAGGDPISVFGWFDVPSVTGRVDRMEDLAGEVHYWATWALVILAGLHGVAALKHHMVDRDNTLRRMFGR
ncbi:MAG TPA: cytochrome b [Marinobacter sp.]|uniref:cytochrome b n=1 Tax=Marinobacter sp. TaxID=50741 RepID=UPI002608F9BB|nr:cytochrome b [Marinobacter sp.]HET8800754.1 cytochrome b [Marinobacter sp.]